MMIAGVVGKKAAKDKGVGEVQEPGTGKGSFGGKTAGKDKGNGKDKPAKDREPRQKKADKKKPAKDKPAKAETASKPPGKKPDGPVEQKVDPDMPEGIPLALYSRKPKKLEHAPVEKCPECTFPFRVHPREQDVQCPHCFEFLALVPEQEAAKAQAANTDAAKGKTQQKKDEPKGKQVPEKQTPSQDMPAKKQPRRPASPQFDLEVEQVLRPRPAGEPRNEPQPEHEQLRPEPEKGPPAEVEEPQATSPPPKDEGKNNRHPPGDLSASMEGPVEPQGPQPVEAEPVQDEAELEALPSFELEGGDEGGPEGGKEAPEASKKRGGRGLLRRKGK